MDAIISGLVFASVSQRMDQAGMAKFGSAKQRLVEDLFRDYDPRVGALRNSSESLHVDYWMRLYQIIEVIEEKQAVMINTWVTEKWKDEYMTWDPKDYDNVTSIMVPFPSVWTPDTVLWNSIQMDEVETKNTVKIKITMDKSLNFAEMELLYPSIFTLSCSLNTRNFPFDTQDCQLTIGSWSLTSDQINYSPGNVSSESKLDLTNYIIHDEWELQDFSVDAKMELYACCPSPWSLIIYKLRIRRLPLHYIVNLIIPTIVISLISLLGYFSPTTTSQDRTEKVTLGVTTLLAMAILLLNVSDKMPTTSNFLPAIGLFFLNMIMLIAMGAGGTIMVVWVQHRGKSGNKPGSLVVRSANAFGCLLGIAPFEKKGKCQEEANTSPTKCLLEKYDKKFGMETASPTHGDNIGSEIPHITTVQNNDLLDGIRNQYNTPLEHDLTPLSPRSENQFGEVYDDLDEGFSIVESKRSKEMKKNRKHWHWIATVVERGFLVLSIFFLTAICLHLFVKGYNLT